MIWALIAQAGLTLVLFSLQDIYIRKVYLLQIIFFAFLGIVINIIYGQYLVPFISSFLLFILGYLLWKFKAIGGADAKIITVLGLYLPISGIPNMFIVTITFVIILGILAAIYSLIQYILNKNRKKKMKNIPFVPIIAMAYGILLIIGIH